LYAPFFRDLRRDSLALSFDAGLGQDEGCK
jgi:hypothetical protein